MATASLDVRSSPAENDLNDVIVRHAGSFSYLPSGEAVSMHFANGTNRFIGNAFLVSTKRHDGMFHVLRIGAPFKVFHAVIVRHAINVIDHRLLLGIRYKSLSNKPMRVFLAIKGAVAKAVAAVAPKQCTGHGAIFTFGSAVVANGVTGPAVNRFPHKTNSYRAAA